MFKILFVQEPILEYVAPFSCVEQYEIWDLDDFIYKIEIKKSVAEKGKGA